MQKDQIDILLALAKRGVVYNLEGIVAVPDGFDLAAVADAIASAEQQPKDDALVVEFLRRLAPNLLAAAVDAVNITSGPTLATQYKATLDVLAVLGQPARDARAIDGRMTVARGDGEVDLPEWTPLEVVDALTRIAARLDPTKAWTAPRLAGAVLMRLDELRNAKVLLSAVGDLLSALDPEFDGDVTLTAIEQATRMAERGERPKSTRVKVCSVNNIVHAVTVLGSVAGGDTLTSDALRVMSLGEEMRLPGGAWIVRTNEGWELWSDAQSSAHGRAMGAALASAAGVLADPPYGGTRAQYEDARLARHYERVAVADCEVHRAHEDIDRRAAEFGISCGANLAGVNVQHEVSAEMVAELRAQLGTALDAIDMIGPRPWEAIAEVDGNDDESEWSIYDANDNRITSSWGPKDGTSPGEWTRATVATVNALPVITEMETHK